MTLLQQFQALVGSIFFGFIFTHLWYVFNRMFYKWEGTFKRFILEVPLFISFPLHILTRNKKYKYEKEINKGTSRINLLNVPSHL